MSEGIKGLPETGSQRRYRISREARQAFQEASERAVKNPQEAQQENLKYDPLRNVLDEAYSQAAVGKGAKRHAGGKPFIEQPIMRIQDMVGPGFALGQAIKKIDESQGLDADAAERELLGAIVYIAGAIIRQRSQCEDGGDRPSGPVPG